MMEQDMQQILFTQDQVAARVQELAAQITRDYAGKTPLVVGVLRGSFIFMADLVRHLDLPLTLDFMAASSYGVGMQLKNAIDLGFKHFIIGLGGSGMCDGGAGALAALGVAFYDRNGTSIPHPTGGDLQRIERLQIPADFQDCVKGMHFTYACDVTNP